MQRSKSCLNAVGSLQSYTPSCCADMHGPQIPQIRNWALQAKPGGSQRHQIGVAQSHIGTERSNPHYFLGSDHIA